MVVILMTTKKKTTPQTTTMNRMKVSSCYLYEIRKYLKVIIVLLELTESENEFTTKSRDYPNLGEYRQPLEIKEQMYQEKLAQLNSQIEALHAGTHPDYIKKMKKLEVEYKERLRLNEVDRDYHLEFLEKQYLLENKAADKEYEDKKMDLKENLLTDYEDKRKMIENERNTTELNTDSTEVKPTVTRKLRRRPNEPIPLATNEKRRKPTTNQLVYQLDEKDIDLDLKFILRPLTPNSCKFRHCLFT